MCSYTVQGEKIGFNPHLHVGGDLEGSGKTAIIDVSIHTSTWEVTNIAFPFPFPLSFQSTPPRGR